MRTIDPLAVLCLLLVYTFETASGRPTDPSDTVHVVASSNGQYGRGVWTSDNGASSMGQDSGSMADPPRLPTPPAATVSEGGGWLARWLSMGGEGEANVILGKHNLTFPHRPAAFPSQLLPPMALPIAGILQPFTAFLNDSDPAGPESSAPTDGPSHSDSESDSPWGTQSESQSHRHSPIHRPQPGTVLGRAPELACYPPRFPVRYIEPPHPWRIALVERGECDFASKVRAAQERGAAGVIVGDMTVREGETDEEGRTREGLITMFSPEDTDAIFIPSVFVSRASYLALRDMLGNGTTSGKGYEGLWIEIGEGQDDGATLSSLLSFALLMPSLFLCATIAIHRFRVARQREADRAPPLVVLSLPERVWSPDIVWEKDSETDSNSDAGSVPASPTSIATDTTNTASMHTAPSSPFQLSPPSSSLSRSLAQPFIPPPPPIGPDQVATPPPVEADAVPLLSAPMTAHASGSRKKHRTKSGLSHSTAGKKYFSKDECAICMDSFHRGDVVRILPCGHVFHKDECDEWLLKWRKLCPTCRADVTLPPGEVGQGQGTTITPVMGTDASASGGTDGEGVEPREERGLVARLNDVVRSRWDSLVRRGQGGQSDEEEVGERTPLVRNEV